MYIVRLIVVLGNRPDADKPRKGTVAKQPRDDVVVEIEVKIDHFIKLKNENKCDLETQSCFKWSWKLK